MSEVAASPQPLSKREQKRMKGRANDRQESRIDSDKIPNGAASPLQGEKKLSEAQSSPYLEPFQKRIRNYLKKKQKIDKYGFYLLVSC
jgi:hypothetical protein